jgi:hypothetical protein
MFGEVPFADVPFAALGGSIVEVTVNGISLSLQIGCFHVSAWENIPDVAATWSSVPAASSVWSGVTVTTTIWNEIC